METLTKLEQIAAMALQGLLTGDPDQTYRNAAVRAKAFAHELLKELDSEA